MNDDFHDRSGPTPSAEHVFDVLVRQNAGPLLAFIRSMVRNEAMVDDVFQETMMIAWRRLADYDRDRPFGPWLRGISHKVAYAQFRKQGRVLVMDINVVEALEANVQRLEYNELETKVSARKELNECVSRLPVAFREAIEFVYRGNQTTAEAATAAQVGVEAMKKRLQRARAMLAKCLRGKGILA